MTDVYRNLSTSGRLSLTAADAALKILHEKIAEMKNPLVTGTEEKLFNNQLKNLAKLELDALENVASSIEAITMSKRKILEAELICKTSETLMEKVITDAFTAFKEYETQVNEMLGKLEEKNYNFLADEDGSKPESEERVITKELPSVCDPKTPVSHLGRSFSTLNMKLERPVYTSSYAKELVERTERKLRIKRALSTKKSLSRKLFSPARPAVKRTSSFSQSGRSPLATSGGSTLNGTSLFFDQTQEVSTTDKCSLLPYRDRLMNKSNLLQPEFDETESSHIEIQCPDGSKVDSSNFTSVFTTFEECETQVNEMHGNLDEKDFLTDDYGSKSELKERFITKELPSVCDPKTPVSRLDKSFTVVGRKSAHEMMPERPVYSSSYGRELMARSISAKQAVSTKKSLSRKLFSPDRPAIQSTSLFSQSGRLPLAASSGSNLPGTSVFFNRTQDVSTTEMHGNLDEKDFLTDDYDSKSELKERVITKELPSVCDPKTPVSSLGKSFSVVGRKSALDMKPERPVYSSSYARELVDRTDKERQIKQALSAKKSLSRKAFSPTRPSVQATSLFSQSGRLLLATSSDSTLPGTSVSSDRTQKSSS